MAMFTVQGVVEDGRIKLADDITLPEHTKVLVVIPDAPAYQQPHIRSPRLANPSQAADFTKRVTKVTGDAQL